MKLTITSEVNTNVGVQATDMIGNIKTNTDTLLATGKVFCNIDFYVNDNAETKGMNKLFPVVLKENGTIDKIVTSCTIILTQEEAEAANLLATIYNKVAAKLSADYGWKVTVLKADYGWK